MSETALHLDRVAEFVRRYVVLGPHELTACTLWTLHTHVLDAAYSTPYLAITSAVPESGKTRLLEVLARVVASPWMTGSTSTAALVRQVDSKRPSLLYDESDNTFKRDKEFVAAFQGILNTGYRRGGAAAISVKQGGDWEVRNFSTYCPKALAGLGSLPDTVASRSIPIVLKRRAPGETVEKFRERRADEEAEPIYVDLCSWGAMHVDSLALAEPKLPPGLSDRAEDVWEPLFAIAELAGSEWTRLAWEAAPALSSASALSDDQRGIRLLEDIAVLVGGLEDVASADLVSGLNDLPDAPWSEVGRGGKPLTQRKLADLLSPFEVFPRQIRHGTVRGYIVADFQDPFRRYLVQTVKPSKPQEPSRIQTNPEVSSEPGPDGSKNGRKPHEHTVPDALTVQAEDHGLEDLGTASLDTLRERYGA